MEEHQAIRLCLDRDAAEQNCTNKAMELGRKYTVESSLYKSHKDLNEYLVKLGKPLKKHSRLKLR